ncbi:MAG: cobalt-precorrin-5B (C(1))-methyltransferase [Candidatus Nitrosocaldaceae archaeon]
MISSLIEAINYNIILDYPLIMEEVGEKKVTLRTGYTTGTCAAAATKAALLALVNGIKDKVTVTLPKGGLAEISVHRCNIINSNTAEASVIKDAGDDPDVTHGAEIISNVTLTDHASIIEIDGGKGVGRVTKPGLGLEIGKAAINPVPMSMIRNSVREVLSDQLNERGVKVIISVTNGEEIAKKTDNPRLGIIGGISILGTTGIVIPYSTASFAASIRQAIDVAYAMNDDTIVLTTGGRSEDFIRVLISLPEHCYIQMGDFAAYSIRQAAIKGMKRVIIAGFIGKLSKIAMGIKQTHVKGSNVDMEFLAAIAGEVNADSKIIEEIRSANTARHVSEIVMKHALEGYFDLLCRYAYNNMKSYAEKDIELIVVMFDFDGKVIGSFPKLKGNKI